MEIEKSVKYSNTWHTQGFFEGESIYFAKKAAEAAISDGA